MNEIKDIKHFIFYDSWNNRVILEILAEITEYVLNLNNKKYIEDKNMRGRQTHFYALKEEFIENIKELEEKLGGLQYIKR